MLKVNSLGNVRMHTLRGFSVDEMRKIIAGMAKEKAIILSTHILPEVTMTCEKVLIINQGKRVAYDEIKNLASVHGQAENASLEEIFIKLTAA